MLSELDTYDWENAFEFAAKPEVEPPGATFLDYFPDAIFTRECVKEIVAIEEGENDGDYWIAIFELVSGLFLVLEAGCDYTGWD